MPRPMLSRKIEANAYLPRLAEGYVCGELTLDDLVAYFKAYAHLYTVGIDVNAICNLACSYSYLDISLDGCSRTNDAVRGRDVFRRAATNVRLLKDSGFQVWISSVLHTGNNDPNGLEEFLRVISSEYGCGRFYFSPVRNFTGGL